MESISSEKLPLIRHTLDKLSLAIDRLQERTVSIQTVDDFLATPGGMEKLDAACMVLIAIGETVKNLDKITEKKLLPIYPAIRWKNVMGIRDIIAHHYFEVDADVVFEIVNKQLASLKEAVTFFQKEL